MPRITLEDPVKVFRFRVSVDKFDMFAGFSECSGLSVEFDTVDYRECNTVDTVQKSPGLLKFGDITLKRGQYFSGKQRDIDFAAWYKEVTKIYANSSGTELMFRRPMSIFQYNNMNVAVVRYDIKEAWPRIYKPNSDLNATSSENSIEEITLANEGWDAVPLGSGIPAGTASSVLTK